uniref:protein-tyrosine-phosphatase n=1 Tax=Hemiselmis andersenii TaxID=464988 RepID=A0A6T8G8X8_HEMAN
MEAIKSFPKLFFFSNQIPESYEHFCLDFGPVSLSGIVKFCRDLRAKRDHVKLQKRPIVFYTYDGLHDVANACFLLGAFLVLDEGHTPEAAAALFDCLQLPPFRDATYSNHNTYPLTILDALRGLKRAVSHGWFDHLTFDVASYEDLYDPRKLECNLISPEFVALCCPPEEASTHAELLSKLGVTDLVRLNFDSHYDPKCFEGAGVAVHDLSFRDCTCPSPGLIAHFLDVCDSAKGVIGVHCLAGLGRTGTMIGCYLIKNHGFSAAEAIAYMRLCRPGSVIGRQQHFLEEIEKCEWDANMPLLPEHSKWKPSDLAVVFEQGGMEPGGAEGDTEDAEADALAKQVSDAMRRRREECWNLLVNGTADESLVYTG